MVKGILSLIAALVVCAPVAWADDPAPLAPDQVQVSTPVYHPALDEFKPMQGTYYYTVAWQGIPAA